MIYCYYRIIIADITNATKHLDPAYSDKSPSPERDMAEAENASQQFLTTQEAQAAIICDLSLLSNVMTASRSVKGVGGYCSTCSYGYQGHNLVTLFLLRCY